MVSETAPLVGGEKAKEPEISFDELFDTAYKYDSPERMTFGRRIARYLSKFRWYNPNAGKTPDQDGPIPSLDRAWAYFEHVTLTRHLKLSAEDFHNSVDVLRMADAGESDKETELYSVFQTPEADMADFGIGVALYFFTLRCLSMIMLVAGLISLPNILYFSSKFYNAAREASHVFSLEASAICTDQSWMPCPSCKKEDWSHFPATYERYAEAGDLKFTLINNCRVGPWVGLVAFSAMVFVCLAVYALQKAAHVKERAFDIANQSTSDYSIEVKHPPKDARDVEKWRDFFSQFGHVTSITVALDNEDLVRALIERRKLMGALQNLQPPNVTVLPTDIQKAVETAQPVAWYLKCLYSDGPTIGQQIRELDEKIKTDLSLRTYDVSNIFCIFETEASKDMALRDLKVTGFDLLFGKKSAVDKEHLFEGEYLLRVSEPYEPSSVRWEDLDDSPLVRFQQRLLTFFLTVGLIFCSCFLATHVRHKYGISYAALTITGINSVAPTVCQTITDFESHASEGSKQASLYYKTTACLWIVSAILTGFITPFVDTLAETRESLIPAMFAIFITEMLKTPITQAMDIPGNFYRHVLGPRAPDQRRMNACFTGTPYMLAERYTDMTTVMFMCFYYAVIFPAGFFFASITLAVHYWVDKFCLLRAWRRAPLMGRGIADMSRIYFFSSALAIYAVMSSYNFASFPYDNACNLNTTAPEEYVGNFSAVTAGGESVEISIAEGDIVYKYCNQDMLMYDPPAFPAVPSRQPEGSEWMKPEQWFTSIFGWTSVFMVLYVCLIFINAIRRDLTDMFLSRYQPTKKVSRQVRRESEVLIKRRGSSVQMETFSSSPDLPAYIPAATIPGYLFPTLLCDVSNIDDELISWEDAEDRSRKSHNAIYDIVGLADKPVFSVVKEWKPKGSKPRPSRGEVHLASSN